MLFNSLEFAIFLPIVFFCYWFIFNHSLRLQNLFLLTVSYIFYGWWDYRFLVLIALSSLIDFFVGLLICNSQSPKVKKIFLYISLSVNIGLLGIFKYYNFFVESWIEAWSMIGYNMTPSTLHIILPVGISFYTFQTLSYTIDVYKGKIKHTKNIIAFFAFISFFPQLVAGPIERASNLLPQFCNFRVFQYKKSIDGAFQVLWGLFKKVVIADNCAFFVNKVFESPDLYSSGMLFLTMIFFAFQIYGDFSGYSDIAIGISKLFGFSLKINFSYPYFSRNIGEFWRRWHISLTSWFKDYIYIPLGGSRKNISNQIRNTFIIFIISGFWHGANWTFIFWGIYNAFLFLPSLITKNNRRYLSIVGSNKSSVELSDFLKIIFNFILVCFGWVIFRSDSMSQAFLFYKNVLKLPSFDLFIYDLKILSQEGNIIYTTLFCLLFTMLEWISREKVHALQMINRSKKSWLIILLSYFILFSILFYPGSKENFIYFQF